MAKAVEEKQAVYLESELGDLQKEKVKMLASKVLDLNLMEIRYLHVIMVEKAQKSAGLNPMKLNLDWPSVKRDGSGSWPPANPNWFKQQELMASLGPFMGMMGGGAPAAG